MVLNKKQIFISCGEKLVVNTTCLEAYFTHSVIFLEMNSPKINFDKCIGYKSMLCKTTQISITISNIRTQSPCLSHRSNETSFQIQHALQEIPIKF